MMRDADRIIIGLLILMLGTVILGFELTLRRCAPRVLWVREGSAKGEPEEPEFDHRQGVLPFDTALIKKRFRPSIVP